MLGGEKFPPIEDVFPLAAKGVQFYNAYGVTEMSVWQSLVKVNCRRDSQPCEVPISLSGDGGTGLRNTWVKLIHKGKVVEEDNAEGEVAVYSDVRLSVQSPAVPDDKGCYMGYISTFQYNIVTKISRLCLYVCAIVNLKLAY